MRMETREVGDNASVTADWDRWPLTCPDALLERLGELCFAPTGNVVIDNRRRREIGLPIERLGKWGRR